jgi:hypothetical protein
MSPRSLYRKQSIKSEVIQQVCSNLGSYDSHFYVILRDMNFQIENTRHFVDEKLENESLGELLKLDQFINLLKSEVDT